MKLKNFIRLLFILILPFVLFTAKSHAQNSLEMVVIEVDSIKAVRQLQKLNFDIAAIRDRKSGKILKRSVATGPFDIEAVISAEDKRTLEKLKFKWRQFKSKATTKNQSLDEKGSVNAEQDTVYHSFDEVGLGIRDQLIDLEKQYPAIMKLQPIGYSLQSRPILAVKLTQNRRCKRKQRHCRKHNKKKKPQVLFHATTHAREWVSTQMAMRLINYLASNYEQNERVTDLLNSTEVWIIPVINPDGYQYTFTNERLWRKNLRDNNNDGQITNVDGVDLNRNYASDQWGLDNEGSSDDPSDNTYRGPHPASEPETKALVDFILNKDFKFSVSYHTYSDLILYPIGWQVRTESLDDPIFVAQSGTDDNAAIYDSIEQKFYDPGVSADLYITNGDYVEWAYSKAKIPSYTIELTDGYAFEFPDDEALVHTVFTDNLEFALSVAESAKDPANPVSPVGIETQPLYHQPITQSYGENQMIEILARKSSRAFLVYNVNGSWRYSRFEPALGEYYNTEPGVYYSRYVANIRGQSTGTIQQYYIFSRNSGWLGPYNYTAESVSGNPILLMAAEDYSGDFPTYSNQTEPNYIDYYTKALDANGYSYDVWDVDKQGIPDYLEVLAHYDNVIWYTGDDFAPTVPLGLEQTQETEVLQVRDYINYNNGKILMTGQDISSLSTVFDFYSDDFFQYYLGAETHIDGGGMNGSKPFAVEGIPGDPIFDGISFKLSGRKGANNQTNADTFIALTPNAFYSPVVSASYSQSSGNPFEPHNGDYYMYSQQSSASYMRLGGSFDIPNASRNPRLQFWASYIIEQDWDYFFVEVCQQGTDICTTLPEVNGLSTTSTGQSCPSGITSLHPFLANYMDDSCNPSGASGQWNAITGNSSGWKRHRYDLTRYADSTVDIYISYMTDWGTNLNGVFVDDIKLTGNSNQGFETGLTDWTVSSAPGGEYTVEWLITENLRLPSGPVIRNDDTVYMGFGFEAINNSVTRSLLMNRIINYFDND